MTDWNKISGGVAHTLATKTGNTLWAWGAGGSGRMPTNSTANLSSPVQVGALLWTDIAAGNLSSALIRNDGTLWTVGSANSGRLANNAFTGIRLSPGQVGALTDWSRVSMSYDHTLALKTDKTLWAWGANVGSALGDGTSANRSSVVQIGTNTNWEDISAGIGFSIGKK